MQTTLESYLSVDELSAWLKVKNQTIYQWSCADKIPHVKIGGKLRFDPSEIRKWIKKNNSAA